MAWSSNVPLGDWIEAVTGGTVTMADRRPGGGRREAWVVDVERPGGGRAELFLRFDPATPEPFDPYTLHREAGVYRALAGSDVPVPHVIGVHPEAQAILSDRIPGDTWFSRLKGDEERLAVAEDFITKLAALHRLDPRSMELPGMEPVSRVPDHLTRELDIWEGLYRHWATDPDPLAELGLRWLRRHIPSYEEPVVLVQGDTGPGNFLYQHGRVTAVLDWELAHLGDPMEDLGWLALRAVQEPFTHLPDRLRQYEELSSHPLDVERIRYYRVFAELRVVILGVGRRAKRDLHGEVGNGLIYGALHDRLFVEALAESAGVDLAPPEDPQPFDTDHTWLYDAALAQLREHIVPRIDDPFAVLRSKGLARVLKHLREIDRDGRRVEAAEIDELTGLLGQRPATVGAGGAELARAIRSGDIDDAVALAHLGRQVARRTHLMGGAMGALADRHFDPLE